MNLTAHQYISGLEQTARNLPGLLSRWADLDDDPRDHIVDEVVWMASVFGRVVREEVHARRLGNVSRLVSAGARLRALEEWFERCTGAMLSIDVATIARSSIRDERRTEHFYAANDDGIAAAQTTREALAA